MPKIYIIGFMGSGKSFTGKRLSALLGYKFYDIDSLFEEKYHFTIHDFFEKFGEEAFRKLESDLLISTHSFENAVISTGGGTPCFFENMEFIKENGISVYLKMPPEKILYRLNQSKKPRPLVKSLQGAELLATVKSLLEKREEYYLRADIIIEAKFVDPAEIVTMILKQLQGYLSESI
ncbi:MAG: shikimate kinase [Bacteroidales bacterium]